jgi:molecular chaperone DnaK
MQRLKEAAEKAKVELSNVVQTNINLPFLSSSPEGPLHLDVNLTRAQLEAMTADLLERMVGPTRQALADARLEPAGIDRVLLVGGSTRMPAVQALAVKVLGKEPFRGVNPDEVVAAGAAIQAGVLSGEVKDILLLDVTPLSLGIETLGGVMTRLIERNTTIPTSKSEMFTTAADSQQTVEIKVHQGEREIAAYNKLLGTFQLTGIRPARRGTPKIEVTFDIDVNGIVHASAKDTATGNEQSITLTSSTGLAKDEIERMVRDAEAHAEEDRQRRDELELHNRADSLIDTAERTMRETKEAAPEAAQKVQAAIEALRASIGGDDHASVRSAMDALGSATYELTAAAARAEAAKAAATSTVPEQQPAATPGDAEPGVETEAETEAATSDEQP